MLWQALLVDLMLWQALLVDLMLWQALLVDLMLWQALLVDVTLLQALLVKLPALPHYSCLHQRQAHSSTNVLKKHKDIAWRQNLKQRRDILVFIDSSLPT
jgi:hypothetical protein